MVKARISHTCTHTNTDTLYSTEVFRKAANRLNVTRTIGKSTWLHKKIQICDGKVLEPHKDKWHIKHDRKQEHHVVQSGHTHLTKGEQNLVLVICRCTTRKGKLALWVFTAFSLHHHHHASWQQGKSLPNSTGSLLKERACLLSYRVNAESTSHSQGHWQSQQIFRSVYKELMQAWFKSNIYINLYIKWCWLWVIERCKASFKFAEEFKISCSRTAYWGCYNFKEILQHLVNSHLLCNRESACNMRLV